MAPPARTLELVRDQLANGLEVVVLPDHAVPVVAVSVVYDVGFRSEPEGRTGFAHLFEHLMFQGSAGVGKMEHARLVQGAGGVFNGHTRPDLTSYYEALPAPALELALFLEADRMGRLALDQEKLENQIAVVQEEIWVNVLNRPYGGFPWIDLPAVAFDSFANAHNGYGSFEDLEGASLEDAAAFYRTYYAPANAVLAVCGDCEPERVLALAEEHFGPIEARPKPARPSFAEPPLPEPRRRQVTDPRAPSPAVAYGLRAPDPVGDLDRLLDCLVVAALLGDGDASRLRRRLVHEEGVATDVGCYLGTFGDPLSMRDPLLFQVTLFHPGVRPEGALWEAIVAELGRLAEEGPAPEELARVRAVLEAERWRGQEDVLDRALEVADLTVIHQRPELLVELPARLGAVDEARVRAAARWLAEQHPAVLEVLPGGEAR
ncbi:M16 family metallopeptidase [Aciditerrimonas ferrireducens]|uniref:M16 family metallopeptidase n=1 Tax=Aciditerrimonas ferrireducens TaxID=667306 RepID=UPI0020059AA1|nr:pitrilysin family protein [Aciditerrimonas ferrireducens]MCK4176468.1 insulinase family protein [Aciditerrimonas ferrireducens]